jgi:general L-amino acid transport system permease protein
MTDSSFRSVEAVAIEQAILENEPVRPPTENLSPLDWAKQNLFNSRLNTIITVVTTPIAIFALYRFFRFVLVTGRWEPVNVNLELFMVGTYPRDELWRTSTQIVLAAGALGLALGLLRSAALSKAEETGEPFQPAGWRTLLSSYWSIILFVLVLLSFTGTLGPWLLAGGAVVALEAGWLLGGRVPAAFRPVGWTVTGLLGVVAFQVMSGTGGLAWFFLTLALVPAVSWLAARLPTSAGLPLGIVAAVIGAATMVLNPSLPAVAAVLFGLYGLYLAFQGDRVDAARIGLVAIAGAASFVVARAIGLEGIDWREWGGLHINLIVAGAAIVLAFPLGIMLAMGRRSSLPAVRYMSVTYIEFFRGAPLITFLLAAQFFLGFFLDTDTPPSLITRAIAAITLFSGAYIAEIIRGGLQAVPTGQTEAGQALGLSAPKVMRLIVLPQALRAVIPAMVGQFIALFKDTTLLLIIGVPEFLRVRTLVHSQEDFRAFGIAETLVFVAFGFWAVAYSMSRESQRLERRLAVGQR